jgi:hypothetical protein
MNKRLSHALFFVSGVLIAEIVGCQRETPTEETQPPQPALTVDQAAQQAVESVKTPMDKAHAVEGMLGEAANRTADRAKEASP